MALLTAVEERFDRWRVWISDTGTWWAARRSTLTSAQTAAGYSQYVRAKNGERLMQRLEEQENRTPSAITEPKDPSPGRHTSV